MHSAFNCRFHFRHIKPDLWFGCQMVSVAAEQSAFVARPEKAVLDLLYLTPGADDPFFLRELRLQNLERLDRAQLHAFAERMGSLKVQRCVTQLIRLADEEGEAFETLSKTIYPH